MESKKLALDLLKEVEGCKLKKYLDGGGVETIGYGHTGPNLPDEITQEEAEAFLMEDLEEAYIGIAPKIKVDLTSGQMAACLSFTFNVGTRAFKESTLLKRLNAKDFKGAVAEFERWVYDNGKYVEGLKNRRHKEMDLFNS